MLVVEFKSTVSVKIKLLFVGGRLSALSIFVVCNMRLQYDVNINTLKTRLFKIAYDST